MYQNQAERHEKEKDFAEESVYLTPPPLLLFYFIFYPQVFPIGPCWHVYVRLFLPSLQVV